MSGISRIIIGEMSQESKGEAYVNELNKVLSPEAISKKKADKQPVKIC